MIWVPIKHIVQATPENVKKRVGNMSARSERCGNGVSSVFGIREGVGRNRRDSTCSEKTEIYLRPNRKNVDALRAEEIS